VPLIVDASVAAAWFVRNQASAYTDRMRRQARNQRLHVPAIWPLEFANALWQLQRRNLLSVQQVDTIIDLAERLDLMVHASTPPPRRLLAIARAHHLSAYDASYLDLALTLKFPIACRDGPLRQALRAAGARLA
jgi:predicted nucleic acid-binding protein